MENKVLTEDVVVEHIAQNVILEHVAVSGVLYVTVDKKLLSKHIFKDHVKLQIVFDNNVNELKENSQLQSGDEADENSKDQVKVKCEEEDMIDDALSMKFGSTSNDSIHSKKTEPKLAQEYDTFCRKRRRTNNSPVKKSTSASKSKLSVSKKRKTSCGKSKKNSRVKPIASRIKKEETESIALDEKNSDFLLKDSDDQEMQAQNEHSDSNEVFSCPYCSKTFRSQKDLSNHRKVDRKHYPCPKCHRVLRYKAYLMIHMRDHHQEPKPKADKSKKAESSDGKSEKCDICGSVFSSLNNLKVHLMIHTSEYQFKCCVCQQEMLLARGYERHMAKHSKVGRIECKICKIRVHSRSELSKHQLTHPLHCGLCGQVFPNKTGRYFHYKTVHKNDILKCPLCNRLYSCKKALDKHLKYHRNRHQTQCPVCGLFFYRLQEHMVLHGGSEKVDGEPVENPVYVCDKCPKQFSRKRTLERHLKTHSEEKPYTCSECSKQFAHSGGLSRHMVTHMHEKPYVCKVCGKACSQKGNLRVHMQIHKADKASKVLQCSHCGANFSHNNALQEHIDKEHRVEENILQFPQQYFQMNTFYHGQFS